MSPRVSWRYDRTTEPWLRWLTRAGAAVVYGAWLAGATLVLIAVGIALLHGSTALRLLVVLLALVGGPVSVLYLLPLLRDPEQRRALFSHADRALSWRERVTAAISGAIAVTATFVVDPRLTAGLVVAGVSAWLVSVVLSTAGHVDTATKSLDTGHRTWDLDGLTGYAVYQTGPLAVVSLDADGPGRLGRVPSFVVVPRSAADRVADALDDIATPPSEPNRAPNPAVRAVAVFVAVCAIGGGLVAWAELRPPLNWYVLVVGLALGGLFLAVARAG